MFSGGYWVLWLMMMIGFFVYCRSDMVVVASGRNGAEMDTMIAKTYGVFLIQVAVGLAISIFPIVLLLLGVSWLVVGVGSFITVLYGLMIMVSIKDVTGKTIKTVESRKAGEVYHYGNSSVYRAYKVLTNIWLVLIVVKTVIYTFYPPKGDVGLLADIAYWLMMITYILLMWRLTTKVQNWIRDEEIECRDQIQENRSAKSK